MNQQGEIIKIKRHGTRLHSAEVYDKHGGLLCNLPLIGVETREVVGEKAEARLIVHGPRVIMEDE